MDISKNGNKLFFKNIFSKKISGYLKVCAEDPGQSTQILPTSSEDSDESECESSKNGLHNVSSSQIAQIKISDQVRFFSLLLLSLLFYIASFEKNNI